MAFLMCLCLCRLENSNTEAFLSRQDEYTDAIEALEATLNQSVQELRQAPNTKVLDDSFNKVKSLVGDNGTIKESKNNTLSSPTTHEHTHNI